MHHTHIDRIASLNSPVHSMDPRAKLVTTLIFIFTVVLTPDGYFASFGLYALVLSMVITMSRVPLKFILLRSLAIMPFALAVSVFVPFITTGTEVLWEFSAGPFEAQVSDTGFYRFLSMNLRVLICFFATIILVSTTRFGDLMRAAGMLGMPSKIVEVMSFMYRYLFIVIDEAAHMMLARDLRSYKQRRLSMLHATGGIIGALFVRSFEHSERLYMSMLLRGYSGRPVTPAELHLTNRDVVYSVLFLVAALLGFAAGRGIYV